MAPARGSRDNRVMKPVLALVLLCLPALVSAGGRCPSSHASRDDTARTPSAKPMAARSDIVHIKRPRPLVAWQRTLLFEQQIL